MLPTEHLKSAAFVAEELTKIGKALEDMCSHGLYHLDAVNLCFEGETIGVFRSEEDWWNYFPGAPSSK
jgi:hypothetical protein